LIGESQERGKESQRERERTERRGWFESVLERKKKKNHLKNEKKKKNRSSIESRLVLSTSRQFSAVFLSIEFRCMRVKQLQ